MTTLPSGHSVASVLMPLSERFWTFGPFIVTAFVVALVTLPWARNRYRQSRRKQPLARLVWIMAGAGMELLAGAAVADGIYGVLGFDGLPATVFLTIAVVCGAIGILTSGTAIIINIIGIIADRIARIRYEDYARDNDSHES